MGAEVLGSNERWLRRGWWPSGRLVQAGARSIEAALAYLRGYYRNATVGAWFGPPQIRGDLL